MHDEEYSYIAAGCLKSTPCPAACGREPSELASDKNRLGVSGCMRAGTIMKQQSRKLMLRRRDPVREAEILSL